MAWLRCAASVRGCCKSEYLHLSEPTTFLIIMAQMFMMYGFLVLMRGKDTRFQRLLAWIGRYSFGGYLVHALVIYAIAYVTRPLQLSGWHLPVTLLCSL